MCSLIGGEERRREERKGGEERRGEERRGKEMRGEEERNRRRQRKMRHMYTSSMVCITHNPYTLLTPTINSMYPQKHAKKTIQQ